jgi:hypothetical protein
MSEIGLLHLLEIDINHFMLDLKDSDNTLLFMMFLSLWEE